MRNGILSLMGEIVVKVLCKEDLDDAAKKLRDQLLDKMEVSVFTLNWFLKKQQGPRQNIFLYNMVICKLLEYYQSKLNFTLLFLNQEHIHDVNAYVRSKALHVWLELWKEKVKFHAFLLALPHP